MAPFYFRILDEVFSFTHSFSFFSFFLSFFLSFSLDCWAHDNIVIPPLPVKSQGHPFSFSSFPCCFFLFLLFVHCLDAWPKFQCCPLDTVSFLWLSSFFYCLENAPLMANLFICHCILFFFCLLFSGFFKGSKFKSTTFRSFFVCYFFSSGNLSPNFLLLAFPLSLVLFWLLFLTNPLSLSYFILFIHFFFFFFFFFFSSAP